MSWATMGFSRVTCAHTSQNPYLCPQAQVFAGMGQGFTKTHGYPNPHEFMAPDMTSEPRKSSASVNWHCCAALQGSEGQGNGNWGAEHAPQCGWLGWMFHVIGRSFVGGHASFVWWAVIVHEWLRWALLVIRWFWGHAVVIVCGWSSPFRVMEGGCACFVWWVVVVHGLLGWTSHIVSGSAVVVCGWLYSFRIMVGDGCGWVCSLLFVDFDRGKLWSFMGGHACFMVWWVIIVGGWLVQCGWVTPGFKTHKTNWQNLGTHVMGTGLGWGYKYPTHTHHHPQCQPMTFPTPKSRGWSGMITQSHYCRVCYLDVSNMGVYHMLLTYLTRGAPKCHQGGGGTWILHIQSQKIFQLKLATPPK